MCGLAQAGERLGRTPSAISRQMPLFHKRGRGLASTEAGEVALTYARRILALHDELLETMQGATSQMRAYYSVFSVTRALSTTLAHLASGAASEAYSSCQFHHLYGTVWG
jgi:DNA-binding transcriptional LysR family regulator